jgi:hypothetical protein
MDSQVIYECPLRVYFRTNLGGTLIGCNGTKIQINKDQIKVLCPICGGTGKYSNKKKEIQTKTVKYKKMGPGPFSTYIAYSLGAQGTMNNHIKEMLNDGWTIANKVQNEKEVLITYTKVQ